ncbi:MAG TPA: sulfotransferase family 2 domain-containing protein [Acetobacteraceae bacterium]|nr:sulfotransferase family 2 domain-containing protein [Acetobacteraceae bacterium]
MAVGEESTIEKPPEVVARARVLADAGNVQAALTLLMERRGNWQRVPPVYDAMIGRYSLRTGDAQAAVEHLARAREAYGDAMPVEQRRDFAAALLSVGRIEAAGREFGLVADAGGTITRPLYRTAIDAFRHSIGTVLDEGPSTPYRVLAQAQALVDGRDHAAARALLVDHVDNWACVPPAYSALLGQLLLRAGDRQGAVVHLARARDAMGEDLPLDARLALGTALFETAHVEDAGGELHAALSQGAPITRLELLVAVNGYRRASGIGQPADTSFARNTTFLDAAQRLIYVSVPKNAAGILKTAHALNGPRAAEFAAGKQNIHEFAARLAPTLSREELKAGPGYFRYTVLRDPLRRLLSAYLDRFVREKLHPASPAWAHVSRVIKDAQAIVEQPYDPVRSISFEEFVHYVTSAPDELCDVAWMPQVNFTGRDLGQYDHVGTVERLPDTLDLLESRFGYKIGARPGQRTPIPWDERATLRDAHRALPHELDAFERGMPMPEQFYTRELKQMARKRYAVDIALYGAVSRGLPPVRGMITADGK